MKALPPIRRLTSVEHLCGLLHVSAGFRSFLSESEDAIDNVTPIRGRPESGPAPVQRRRTRAPVKPRWLDPYASREWNRVVAELEPLGILNPSMREILTVYCEVASVNLAVWKTVSGNKDGPEILIPSARKDGAQVKNPVLTVLNQSARLLDQRSRSLLTNPAALMRAETPDLETGDESNLD